MGVNPGPFGAAENSALGKAIPQGARPDTSMRAVARPAVVEATKLGVSKPVIAGGSVLAGLKTRSRTEEAAEKLSERRARVQPCHKKATAMGALAPEVRLLETYRTK